MTEEQARWLTRILETRPKKAPLDHLVVPDDVNDALVEKGLIRWHRGLLEITLDGIRAVARRPLPQD
ncbi:MAG TPA: hypothetical protein VFI49_13140 [Rudaea sp.]|nr:hypothetical protein [Rudaea sp.]